MSESQAQGARFQRIVVGVDGTPSSVAALQWAVGQAQVSGAKVTALMGWRPNVAYGYPDLHVVRESEARALADAVAAVDAHDVHLTTLFANGTAEGLLVNASADADLVVLGARRHHGLVGLVLGSVSEHVLAHAHCPVVVVPEASGDSTIEIPEVSEPVPALRSSVWP